MSTTVSVCQASIGENLLCTSTPPLSFGSIPNLGATSLISLFHISHKPSLNLADSGPKSWNDVRLCRLYHCTMNTLLSPILLYQLPPIPPSPRYPLPPPQAVTNEARNMHTLGSHFSSILKPFQWSDSRIKTSRIENEPPTAADPQGDYLRRRLGPCSLGETRR